MIHIAEPILEQEEINAVNQVLMSGMIAQGPKVKELEDNFAGYCGTKHALAVSSGTAALHAALYAAGIQPGDEVITTPFTFIATANPILMLGAKPVFVDIDPVSFNINAGLVEEAVSPKTKAILPVHLYGQPCDYAYLEKIANQHKLAIIEDACQAIGAIYDGKKAGSLGNAGCFSLYATKNIMSGEGGVVTTNDDSYAEAIKQFRQHGMDAPYSYKALGYNYRMTDLQAAIAVEQLKKADDFNARRQANATILNDQLQNIKGLILPETKEGRTHVYHQFTVRITNDAKLSRDELAIALKEQGIGSGVYYPKPLHAYKHIAKLGYKMGDFPEAERVASEVLSLPIHPRVTASEIEKITAVIKEMLNE